MFDRDDLRWITKGLILFAGGSLCVLWAALLVGLVVRIVAAVGFGG